MVLLRSIVAGFCLVSLGGTSLLKAAANGIELVGRQNVTVFERQSGDSNRTELEERSSKYLEYEDWTGKGSGKGNTNTPPPMPYVPEASRILDKDNPNFMNLSTYPRVRWWFSGHPLTREEYEERNWNWIRCRNKYHTDFDVGGLWFGEYAKTWKKQLSKYCPIMHSSMEYQNQLDWGDGRAEFEYLLPWCTQEQAVQAALDVTRAKYPEWKRQLYIWDCWTHQLEPNFDTETQSIHH